LTLEPSIVCLVLRRFVPVTIHTISSGCGCKRLEYSKW